MNTPTRPTLKDLARTEAQNRLKKLDADAARIDAERTHIRRLIGVKGKATASVTGEGRKATAKAGTKRRKMSAAKRAEAAARMKRIWADRRAAKAKASPENVTEVQPAAPAPEPVMASQ